MSLPGPAERFVRMPSTVASGKSLYADHVNPQWVRLLDVLQLNADYEHTSGCELFTRDGRRILDFLCGYCVYNIGHNHPAVIAALHDELDKRGPAMLQSHIPELAGELAARLCQKAGGRFQRVYFSNSGSEAVDSAIKFARAHTKRGGMLFAKGGFHGLTTGSLSLMDNEFWTAGFGPYLPECEGIAFNDLNALEEKLKTRKFAAFITEPIQAEIGIRTPEGNYLAEAAKLCHKYGSLLVLDEIQTGLHRVGPFLAAQHYNADADIVLLAKGLGGGLMPVGAVLMTEEVCRSVFTSIQRAFVHASTFGENALSMRAALATLDVMENEHLGERSTKMGELLRSKLRDRLAPYEMVKQVVGVGQLTGIQFQKPRKLTLRIAFEAFHQIHPGMFGQIMVMRLFRDCNVLAQICGNNFLMLKAAPPLVINEAQTDEFVDAMAHVVDLMHHSTSFWTEALGMARRTANI